MTDTTRDYWKIGGYVLRWDMPFQDREDRYPRGSIYVRNPHSPGYADERPGKNGIALTPGQIPLLLHHDADRACGWVRSLREDDNGLYHTAVVLPDLLPDDMRALFEIDALPATSMGVNKVNFVAREHGGGEPFTVSKALLYEISLVWTPAMFGCQIEKLDTGGVL